jgi:hypothetical protein
MRLSQELVEWVADSAPPPVAAGGGAFHARGIMDGKSWCWFGLKWWVARQKTAGKQGEIAENKNPPASGAGGVRKETDE